MQKITNPNEIKEVIYQLLKMLQTDDIISQISRKISTGEIITLNSKYCTKNQMIDQLNYILNTYQIVHLHEVNDKNETQNHRTIYCLPNKPDIYIDELEYSLNEFGIIIGDVSCDGHCQSRKVHLESNKHVGYLLDLYLQACDRIGLYLDGRNYGKFDRFKDKNVFIMDRYEEDHIRVEQLQQMHKAGVDLSDIEFEYEYDPISLDTILKIDSEEWNEDDKYNEDDEVEGYSPKDDDEIYLDGCSEIKLGNDDSENFAKLIIAFIKSQDPSVIISIISKPFNKDYYLNYHSNNLGFFGYGLFDGY